MFYKIKRIYKYTDIVVVEADNRADALDISNGIESEDEPQYECLYDAKVIGESKDPIEV